MLTTIWAYYLQSYHKQRSGHTTYKVAILFSNLQPAKRHAYSQDGVFTPVERELVFDIVSVSLMFYADHVSLLAS